MESENIVLMILLWGSKGKHRHKNNFGHSGKISRMIEKITETHITCVK